MAGVGRLFSREQGALSTKPAKLLAKYDLKQHELESFSEWFHWIQGSEVYVAALGDSRSETCSKLMYFSIDLGTNAINSSKAISVNGWLSQVVFLDSHVVLLRMRRNRLVFMDLATEKVICEVKEISDVMSVHRLGVRSVLVLRKRRESQYYTLRGVHELYKVELQKDNSYTLEARKQQNSRKDSPSGGETRGDFESSRWLDLLERLLGTDPTMKTLELYDRWFTLSDKWVVFVDPHSDLHVTQVHFYNIHEAQWQRIVTLPYYRRMFELKLVGDLMLWNGSPAQKRFGILRNDPTRYQKSFGVTNLSTGAYEWDAGYDHVSRKDIAYVEDEGFAGTSYIVVGGLSFAVIPDGTILTTLRSGSGGSGKCVFARYQMPNTVVSLLRSNAKLSRSLETGATPLLQEALKSVLQGHPSPAEHCLQLISKKNCSESAPEWNAAHQLLVLAVRDGSIKASECVKGSLYHWRDQLYCTVADLEISNSEEKDHIYKCLRDAHELELIDSPDAYIEGIHVMECVRKEIVELKRAGLMLLERVLALEGSVEKLKAAFERYRETELYSNLVGIAVQLIPLAGGAMSKVLMAGCEIVEGLSASDVVEYAISIAEIVLEEGEFGRLPAQRQEEVRKVFEEYGYSREDVRLLMRGGGAGGTEDGGGENGGGDGGLAGLDDVDTAPLAAQRADGREEGLTGLTGDEDESRMQMGAMELAEAWTHYTLDSEYATENEVRDAVMGCLGEYVREEDISAETLTAACATELDLMVDEVLADIEQRIVTPLKRGQRIRLRAFVHSFAGSA